MRSWTRKPAGAVFIAALLAICGLAQGPLPFIGKIQVEISPTGAGTVSLDPEGNFFGGIYYYASPTAVELTATPYSGYAFVRWEIWRSIPASGSPEITREENPTAISLTSQNPEWTVRAVFQEVGSLKVTIQPPEAVAAGAQWKAVRNGYDSGWRNSGETISNLPVGQYTVTFKDIANWTKPEDQTVTITKDTLTEVTGTYVQHVGSLKVTIQPPEAVAAGAQWKAVRNGYDSGWRNSGETISNLPVGQYTVTFKDIANWTKPEDQTVTITKDTLTEVTGTYVSLALFFEDFEDITGWTLSGLWHVCEETCRWCENPPMLGKYAHYAIPGQCSYDTGRRTLGYLTSPVITVPQNTELVLMFDFARVVENYTRATRDRTYVQIRLGRGSWRTVWSQSSRNPSPECGTSGAILIRTGQYTTLQIRFVFDSVNRYNNNFPGWAVDNVMILPRELLPAGIPLAEEYVEEFEPLDEEEPLFVLTVFPNPVTGRTVVFGVDGVEAEALQVEVYDLGGRLVYRAETFGGQLTWDTLDFRGQPVANGVYLVLAKVKVEGEWLIGDLQRILILR